MVPLVDLSRRGHRLAAEFGATAARIAASGSILLGPETSAFEQEFAAWLDVPHVVAVSSGASAIQLALAGIGVGPGDEVIVPAFTAVPTASAVCALGAVPVPVDVRADTGALDLSLIEASRTSRTKAVIVVHLYGRRARTPVTDLAVIEDAAQAHGAVLNANGSAAAIYSFYPTKNLGGIGDGGAVVTNDESLAALVRQLRVHGMSELYVHQYVSQNFRMSELEAAWLRHSLPSVREGNLRRGAIAQRYRQAAPHLAWHRDDDHHVYHQCVFRSTQRDAIRADLSELDVATGVHYPLALTQQPGYRQFTRRACPQAEAWAAECISVPCFPELTDTEVDLVANALAKVGS